MKAFFETLWFGEGWKEASPAGENPHGGWSKEVKIFSSTADMRVLGILFLFLFLFFGNCVLEHRLLFYFIFF